MEKEMVTSRKMTFGFIWHYILYSIVITIITGFIYSLIYGKISNVIIMAIISTVLSCITVFIATKLSTKDIFTGKKLDEDNKKKYKRNMIVFFVICIIINIFYYALTYSITVFQIEKISSNLQIANNQDISRSYRKSKEHTISYNLYNSSYKEFCIYWDDRISK